jgi:hypothetical protein
VVLTDVVFDTEYFFGEGFDILNDEGEERFIGVGGTFNLNKFNSKQNHQDHGACEGYHLCIRFLFLIIFIGLSIDRLPVHRWRYIF